MTSRPSRPRPVLFPLPREPWMNYANCKGANPDLFFPRDGHHLIPRPAVEICNFCPVQLSCLKYALDHHIDDGVWGGTTRNDRRRIHRARAARLRLANSQRDRSQYLHG